MNTAAMPPTTAPSRWATLTAPWRQRWQALSQRERRIALTLIWAVALVLLWFVAVAPALRSVRTAPARLDELDAQLQQMQRLATETAALRALPPVGGLQSQSALKAATDALGPAARLTLGGDRATISFTNATGTQVRDWLAEVRSAARVRPIEANLTRGPQGYSGSVIVQMPGSGGSQ
jgi:general secretion pathway protein M